MTSDLFKVISGYSGGGTAQLTSSHSILAAFFLLFCLWFMSISFIEMLQPYCFPKDIFSGQNLGHWWKAVFDWRTNLQFVNGIKCVWVGFHLVVSLKHYVYPHSFICDTQQLLHPLWPTHFVSILQTGIVYWRPKFYINHNSRPYEDTSSPNTSLSPFLLDSWNSYDIYNTTNKNRVE